MTRIHKYLLPGASEEPMTMWMPEGAVVLDAGHQEDVGLVLWAVVDPTAAEEPRRVLATGTGIDLPPEGNWRHIRSVRVAPYVWHVFVEEPEPPRTQLLSVTLPPEAGS